MSMNLKQAFSQKGLNATYEGNPAKLLPVSEAILAELSEDSVAQIGQELKAGDLIVTWRAPSGSRNGAVLDPMAANDLAIMIRKSDGEDVHVEAREFGNAIVRLANMAKEDRQDRKDIAAANEAGERAHVAAVARGNAEGDFKPAKPRFADSAFSRMAILVDCVKSRLGAEYNNAFTGLAGKSVAALGEFRVNKATSHNLTADEAAKATEAKLLRAEIRKLEINAADAVLPEREHGLERVEAALEDLDYPGDGYSTAQMAAMMPDSELMNLAFKPLTSTPVMEIQARRLGSSAVNTVLQDLRRFEDTDWAPGAVAKTRELLKDRMPGYDFQAKVFSRDGADMMLVADHAGAVLYAWDSETRVIDFDTAPEMTRLTEADVPTDEELEDLRVQLRDLRYDAGGEIDFGFADEAEDEPDVLEA